MFLRKGNVVYRISAKLPVSDGLETRHIAAALRGWYAVLTVLPPIGQADVAAQWVEFHFAPIAAVGCPDDLPACI